MGKLIIGVNDPSLTHWGMGKMAMDLDSYELEILDLKLVVTKPEDKKTVRRSSDALRRGSILHDEFQAFMKGVDLVFSEVPSGAQDAKASYAFGIVVGILTSSPAELIQVQPLETKMASVGKKTASKAEMIAWAVEKWPTAPWLRLSGKPTGRILGDNEHLADAAGVGCAGLLTEDFGRFMRWTKRPVAAAA